MVAGSRSTIIVAGRAARWSAALWLLLSLYAPGRAIAQGTQGDDDDSAGDDDSDEEHEGDEKNDEGEQLPRRAVAARVQVEEQKEPQRPHSFRNPASVIVRELGDSVAPGATLADVLAELPGMQLRRFGGPGDPAYAAIRGSSSQQVEIWVDGVPINPMGSAAVNLDELPLEAFDRVEVWRGFAPPDLGGAPIGGIVHLTSKPGTSLPTEIKAGIGSWGTHYVSAGAGASQQLPGGGLGDARLNLSWRGTRGNYPYFDNGGTQVNLDDDQTLERANNAYEQLNLSTQMRLGLGPVLFTLSDRLHWHSGGEPGPGHGTTANARSQGSSNLLGLDAAITLHPRLKLHTGLSYLHRRQRFSDVFGEIVVGATDHEDRGDLLNFNAIARWQALSWLQVHPSLRLNLEGTERLDFLIAGRESSTRRRASFQLGVGATASLWSDRLTILGVADLFVLDNRALGVLPFSELAPGADGSEQALQFLPRLAISLQPAPFLSVRAGVARGFRPPTFSELFGDRAGIIGNPALLPELSEMVDVSLRLAGKPHTQVELSAELGGFFTSTRNAIVLRSNSQRLVVPINFGRTQTGGIEASASLRALGRIELVAALTWIDARIRESEAAYVGNKVPFVPEWDVDLRVRLSPLPWLQFGWSFSYMAGNYDSRSNLFEQAPRALHSVSIRVHPGSRLPWFFVELRNVGDATTYSRDRDPLQADPEDQVMVRIEDFRGNPLPGRSVLFSVGWSPGAPQRSPGAHDVANGEPL